MHQLLLNRDIYDEVMYKRLPEARRFVWIVTADIKDLHLDTGHGFEPLLALLSRLIETWRRGTINPCKRTRTAF